MKQIEWRYQKCLPNAFQKHIIASDTKSDAFTSKESSMLEISNKNALSFTKHIQRMNPSFDCSRNKYNITQITQVTHASKMV